MIYRIDVSRNAREGRRSSPFARDDLSGAPVGRPPCARLRPSGCHLVRCSAWRLRSRTPWIEVLRPRSGRRTTTLLRVSFGPGALRGALAGDARRDRLPVGAPGAHQRVQAGAAGPARGLRRPSRAAPGGPGGERADLADVPDLRGRPPCACLVRVRPPPAVPRSVHHLEGRTPCPRPPPWRVRLLRRRSLPIVRLEPSRPDLPPEPCPLGLIRRAR